jgi:hypothetical protein
MEPWQTRFTRIVVTLILLLGAANVTTGLTGPAAADPAADSVQVIQVFVESIDDGRVSDAMAMISPELLANPETKDGWRRQFSAIRSIGLVGVSEVEGGNAGLCVTYEVRLEVHLAPEAARAPIPNYGWDDNPNIRWIKLCPDSERTWMITSIGTGP